MSRAEPSLWRQFLPLSLSDVIMVLAGPILSAGLARLADPEVSLAAYGVALSVALLIESPIITMLQASTALSRDPDRSRALFRLMAWLSGGLGALHGLVAFTPLFDVVFGGWLGQPLPIVRAARPAFQLLLFWTPAIAWRRYFQGHLITRGLGDRVGQASVVRLAMTALATLVGVAVAAPGSIVAGWALILGVVSESAIVLLVAKRAGVRPAGHPGGSQGGLAAPDPAGSAQPSSAQPNDAPEPRRLLTDVAGFYAPLAATSVLVFISRPFLSAGLARAPEASASLAAWPVAWTSVQTVANATRMVQQLMISLGADEARRRQVRRFAWQVGLLATGLMLAVGLTPLGRLYAASVLGVTGRVFDLTVPTLALLVPYPLLVSLQNVLQGQLVRAGRTGLVNAAAVGGSLVVSVAVLGLVPRLAWPGVWTAAVALVLAAVVEIGLLLLCTARLADRAAREAPLPASRQAMPKEATPAD